jgi:parallel beta-helix repeat protein
MLGVSERPNLLVFLERRGSSHTLSAVLIIAAFLVSALSSLPVPVTADGTSVPSASSLTPSLRSSAWGFAAPANSVSCSLDGVVKGDVLFATVQSATVAQTSITANDSASDSFSYLLDFTPSQSGSGAAYAKTLGSGSVAITVSVGNGGAGLSLFCYDVAGVRPKVTMSQFDYGSTGTALSVPTFSIAKGSFIVAMYDYQDYQGQGATFAPGNQYFVLTNGSPIVSTSSNYIASEYRSSDPVRSENCPMTLSASEPWHGVCFALSPAQIGCGTTITVSTTLTRDIGPCSGNGLVIGANGITLNCKGHTISGMGTYAGVFLNGKTQVIIKNCITTGFGSGFLLTSSSSNKLIGNSASNNVKFGFHLKGSSSNTLSKNTASGDGDYGFYLSGNAAIGNTFTSNTANSNEQYGFFDVTVGSGTAGTGNMYSLNECSLNVLGGSTPTGLCMPQA